MKRRSAPALVLVGMAIVGMMYAAAGQKAFAHTFDEHESATFFVNIYAAKVHLMLTGMNLSDPSASVVHLDHFRMIVNDTMLAEIAEKNERIATDIPAQIDQLQSLIQGKAERSHITDKIKEINNLLREAISVRLDPNQVEDIKFKALVVAGFSSEALTAYEQATGLGSTGMDMGSMDQGSMSMENSGTGMETIVNHDSYIAAKTFATLAKNAFYREHLASNGNADAVAAKNGLVELRNIIYSEQSIEDATIATHIHIHPNLQKAFGIEVAGHAVAGESGDHMDENSM